MLKKTLIAETFNFMYNDIESSLISAILRYLLNEPGNDEVWLDGREFLNSSKEELMEEINSLIADIEQKWDDRDPEEVDYSFTYTCTFQGVLYDEESDYYKSKTMVLEAIEAIMKDAATIVDKTIILWEDEC